MTTSNTLIQHDKQLINELKCEDLLSFEVKLSHFQ